MNNNKEDKVFCLVCKKEKKPLVAVFNVNRTVTGYYAIAENYNIITQAKTMKELKKNMKEAAELHFKSLKEIKKNEVKR